MQLVEEPYKNPNDDKVTSLMLVLNPTVEVLREQEAYPILSLVADIGGILGLFIGFNFLMIWDVFHQVYRKMKKKLELIYNT